MLRSAQVVVPPVSLGSGMCSGTVAVVWLKWASTEILEMNSSVSVLVRGGLPLDMKMKYSRVAVNRPRSIGNQRFNCLGNCAV